MTNLMRLFVFLTCYCLAQIVSSCRKEENTGNFRFTGRLVDQRTSVPLPNIRVTIHGIRLGNVNASRGLVSVLTDTDGNFDAQFKSWDQATYYALDLNERRKSDWQPDVTSQEWDIYPKDVPKNGRKDLGTVRYLEVLERLTVAVETVPPTLPRDTFELRVSRSSNPRLPPLVDATLGRYLPEPGYDAEVISGDLRKVDEWLNLHGNGFTGGIGTVTRTYWAPCGVEVDFRVVPHNRLPPLRTTFSQQTITLTRGIPGAITLRY